MKSIMLIAGAALTTIAAAPATAQQPTTVVKQANVPGPYADRTVAVLKSGKNLETVRCAEFIAVDQTFYPEAVRYAANYGPKGKAHPTVTVAGVETAVPDVVAACKARPGDHFLTAVQTALNNRAKMAK